VVVVPGLESHALGSWKSRDGHNVWIRDFLPVDVPKIRVLLYGYDTALARSESKQSIVDLSKMLLESIKAIRKDQHVRF
jgi:hypothetical protein